MFVYMFACCSRIRYNMSVILVLTENSLCLQSFLSFLFFPVFVFFQFLLFSLSFFSLFQFLSGFQFSHICTPTHTHSLLLCFTCSQCVLFNKSKNRPRNNVSNDRRSYSLLVHSSALWQSLLVFYLQQAQAKGGAGESKR